MEEEFTKFVAGTKPVFSSRDFRAVPEKYRKLILEYFKVYVSLKQFVA